MFKKVLIANRGEIAVRIARACRELGARAVAVYSDVDRTSLHVRLADEAYPIGPAPSRESYLVIEKILGVARFAGCDAIHPGYGFLAENPALARACVDAGVTFIGPSAAAMEQLGSKTAARQIARNVGAPTVPGTLNPINTVDEATEIAREIGFPVILKAVAGGGGKGMRSVARQIELASAWRDATSEAQNAFGDARLYLEKYLERPRHIEIQVLADHHRNFVYLGERECSVQRRHQKVIEEAPSPFVTPELRKAMGEAAVKLARAGNYTNAGTVEFLVDAQRNFYFLEMNTRLQVEHPVTEMVTSLDLVKVQMRIAAGEGLCRLAKSRLNCAAMLSSAVSTPKTRTIISFHRPVKSWTAGFRPVPGFGWMKEFDVQGWTVPNEYDPMLGKLIAWGGDREESLARMGRALQEYYASGIKTNISLFRRILASSDFQKGAIYTRWLDDFLSVEPAAQSRSGEEESVAEQAAAIAAFLWHTVQAGGANASEKHTAAESRWKAESRREQVNREPQP